MALYEKWTYRIMTEFYALGDREKALQIPVSPFCGRTVPQVDKCQKGFIAFIVDPLYKEIARFLPEAKECCQELKQNLSKVSADVPFFEYEALQQAQGQLPPLNPRISPIPLIDVFVDAEN